MRTIYHHGLNKEFTSKLAKGHPDRKAPEEGRKAQQLKLCDNKKKKKEDIKV